MQNHLSIKNSAKAAAPGFYLPELYLWVAGLTALAVMQPDGTHLFSFCAFSYFTDWCPGCGLGHAIAYLVRGDLMASWEAHPLAIPAIAMLGWRCVELLRKHKAHKKQQAVTSDSVYS